MRDTCPERDARARVSKDEDEGLDAPSCFETHRSAVWVVEALALASRCDAPQHEGGREQPVDVQNDSPRGVPVSGLFFTGNVTTSARVANPERRSRPPPRRAVPPAQARARAA